MKVLQEYEDNHFDLIVTDPPYGISFMGKDWDKALPDQEVWKECYRTLKDGKFAFIMCSPRQDVLSRMIISLEDAGFRTNYTSIYWTYASGFPKAANISKLIDKRNGPAAWYAGNQSKKLEYNITKPATPEAIKMEGAYVGFQPKPAVEVILVVSKGKSLTWLDSCRIPYNDQPEQKGRFPANLLVEDDVLNDGKQWRGAIDNHKASSIYGNEMKDKKKGWGYEEKGSYSRYFSLDSWSKTFPFLITPKASKSERGIDNKHPTVKPLKLMSYLVTLGSREGDLILDPFMGSGTVPIAAQQLHRNYVGIEINEEYFKIAQARLVPYLSQTKII